MKVDLGNSSQEHIPYPETEPAGMSGMAKTAISIVVLLMLGAAGAAGYFYMEYDNLKKNPNKVAVDENKATVEAVGKLIVLPDDEQPTLATVTDPAKLTDQPFFTKAKTGDKVLIYTNAKKAILYSPTENKIIEVATINIGDAPAEKTSVSGNSTEIKK